MRRFAVALLVSFVALSLVAPASAQDWERFHPEAEELRGDMIVLFLDPDEPVLPGRYVYATLADLAALFGVELPDRHVRYVAVKAGDDETAFTAADFLAGASGVGVATGIERPAAPANARIRIAAAVPSTAGLDYLAVGAANRFNGVGSLHTRQGVVQIGGVDHDVWAQTAASYAVGAEYVFFDAAAVAP